MFIPNGTHPTGSRQVTVHGLEISFYFINVRVCCKPQDYASIEEHKD